jgi:hypothetical protein
LSQNARPISLDPKLVDKQLTDIAALFTKVALKEREKRKRVEAAPHRVFFEQTLHLKSVRGGERRISIRLRAKPHPAPIASTGGRSLQHRDGRREIEVFINTRLPWRQLASTKSMEEIASTFIHEMTHARDIHEGKKQAEPGTGKRDEKYWTAYYNHPMEVRAFLREIHAEIAEYVRWRATIDPNLGQAVLNSLEASRTWDRIHRYLSPKKHNLVLKALVTSFEDEGIDPTTAPDPRRYQLVRSHR